ncbi:MAG: HD-GYP domain-containing protein [Nitrospirae bacterium]|nr:HD-GYP domain-containing protein [Nitrospirota bacterium]
MASNDIETPYKAIDLINQLGIVLRTAQIHSINNVAVTSAIDKFVSLINDLVRSEHNVSLELRGEYFYLNENRIRYALEYLLNFDYLTREFKKTELGTVIVKSRIDAADIKALVAAFVSSSFLESPFDSIQEKMSGIPHIELKRLERVADDDPTDVRKMIKKTYFKAVSYTRGVLKQVSSGEKINLKKAKRIITSLVNHILDQEQILLGVTAIKDYDEYTYHHSTNVSILSVALGQRLGLSRKMLIDLGIVALFHDIGKMDIPGEILNKPAALTDDEWKVMKNHPEWGVKSILKIRNLDELTINAIIVAFEHHMKFNLTGYPMLENPAEMDLFSRIVSITDQYDAMTSVRVYKKSPMSPEKAISIMREDAGTGIDPLIFKFFVNMVGAYPIGTLVMLDTKEIGIVSENNQLLLQRPRVVLITDNSGNQIKGRLVDLTEKNDRDEFMRTITKTMDPRQYNINLAEYFL